MLKNGIIPIKPFGVLKYWLKWSKLHKAFKNDSCFHPYFVYLFASIYMYIKRQIKSFHFTSKGSFPTSRSFPGIESHSREWNDWKFPRIPGNTFPVVHFTDFLPPVNYREISRKSLPVNLFVLLVKIGKSKILVLFRKQS